MMQHSANPLAPYSPMFFERDGLVSLLGLGRMGEIDPGPSVGPTPAHRDPG